MTENHAPADAVILGLRGLIGDAHVLDRADEMSPYLTDWRKRFTGSALCVVRPGSTADVSSVVQFAAQHGLAIVPQGGNTGLVGGSVPLGRGDEIILSLARMNTIREVDPRSDVMVVEAGVTLAAVQQAAETADRLFPLSLASEGTATIGGVIGTNAGGTAVLAYGNMRDLVLGLEVVLADGRIWNGLGKLRKDNTGYDLRNMFIGSEGTLGIVTAAVVKLFPAPKSRATCVCGLASPDDALAFLQIAKAAAGPSLTTFELIPRLGLDLVLKHIPNTRDPIFEEHAWYVLLEFSSQSSDGADTLAQAVMMEAVDKAYVEDGVFAVSLAQRDDFWRLRESLPEAQTREGYSVKHDISVPLDCLADLIAAVSAEAQTMIAGIRPLPFGHLGDGNLHFNFQSPEGTDGSDLKAHVGALHAMVYRHVLAMKGSISAEHGIGQVKRAQLAATKDPVALDLMRTLKAALDPDGRLNPGKVI